MPPNPMKSAWNQGFRNALVRAAGLLVAYVAISALVAAVTGRRYVDSVGIAFVVFSGIVLLIFIGTWLVGRNVGGRVLLDCGPYPTRGLSILCACLFLAGGAM